MSLYTLLEAFGFEPGASYMVHVHDRRKVLINRYNTWHLSECHECPSTTVGSLKIGRCIAQRQWAVEALVKARGYGQPCTHELLVTDESVPFGTVQVENLIGVLPFGEPRAFLMNEKYDVPILYERFVSSLQDPAFLKEAFGHVWYDVDTFVRAGLGCERGVENQLQKYGIPPKGWLRDLPDELIRDNLKYVLRYLRVVYTGELAEEE